MTKKTRYFVLAAGAVLIVGLGGGLVAYLAYNRVAGVAGGLPPEMRYVPADVAMVAFADVRAVMNSDLRRALMPSIDPESRKGRQMMNDFAGVDVEKQVNRVVAYVEPYTPPDPQSQAKPEIPRALVLVQGTFEPARIEAFIRERAGTMDEYKGRKIFVRREDGHEIAVGLVGSDLIAMGQADLVRRVIDMSLDGSAPRENHHRQSRDDESHSRQCRQHGMGRRAVRRNQPPHAASQRGGRTGAAHPAGVGEGQHQRGRQSDDSRRDRRQGCGRTTARRRPRLYLPRAAAGRRGSRSSRTC